MSANIILGQSGVIEQPKRYSGGVGKPQSLIRTWRGPKLAIRQLVAFVNTLGVWSLEENGPNGTLVLEMTGTLGADGTPTEVPLDQWELVPGAVEKDLLEADNAVINGLTDMEKRAIRDAVANPDKFLTSDPSFAVNPNAMETYRLMLKGMRAIRLFAHVLKHTRTVSNNYAVQASNTNVGNILKNATVIANEGIPAGFLISLAGPPYNSVSLSAAAPLGFPIYDYGWFKHPPTLSISAGSKLQISQEWEFGLWAVLAYGNPI